MATEYEEWLFYSPIEARIEAEIEEAEGREAIYTILARTMRDMV